MLYALSLVCVIIADVLIFSNFKTNFIYITLLNGLFLLCNLAVLKRYLHEQKIKKILTPSVLISVALVAYVFFYVLRLLIETLPNNQVFFAFCTMSFFAAFFYSYSSYLFKSIIPKWTNFTNCRYFLFLSNVF